MTLPRNHPNADLAPGAPCKSARRFAYGLNEPYSGRSSPGPDETILNRRRTCNLLTIVLHLLLLGAMPMADAFAGDQAVAAQCAPDDDRPGDCGSRHAHAGCEFCAALRTASVRAAAIRFIAAPAHADQLPPDDVGSTDTAAQLASTLGARAPPAPRA